MSVVLTENTYRKSSREQVAEVIRAQITSKKFKFGDKLPTTKELVKLAGVSSHTVRQAMNVLENEGLVSSTQGKGTFVNGKLPEKAAKSSNSGGHSIKTIAIMGVMSFDVDLPGRFQNETAAGFMEESQRLGLASHIFPPQLRNMKVEDIFDSLNKINADGVIWPAPVEKEWSKVEALRDRGCHIVATQRADSDSWLPSVAGDYQTAGSEVGQYFIKNNCKKVIVFTYSSTSMNLPITMVDGIPSGLIGGIQNAFSCSGIVNDDLFTVYSNKGYTPEISRDFFDKLSDVSPDCGVIFANSYHFGHLLKDEGEAVKDLLKKRQVVVLSNPSVIQNLRPSIGDLDINFLIYPYFL